MTPAKPLPRLTPVTSTRVPAGSDSTVISWPTWKPSTESSRSSTSLVPGCTPALAKCPASGLLNFLASRWPWVTWSAVYPSRSEVLIWTTRIGSTRSTVTGTTLSFTHFCVIPTFSPRITVCAMTACPCLLIEPLAGLSTLQAECGLPVTGGSHASAPPSRGACGAPVKLVAVRSLPDWAEGSHGRRLRIRSAVTGDASGHGLEMLPGWLVGHNTCPSPVICPCCRRVSIEHSACAGVAVDGSVCAGPGEMVAAFAACGHDDWTDDRHEHGE